MANESDLNGNTCNCHVIGYASSTIKRVSRATVEAETYSLSNGVEEGDRLRAAIADLHGKLYYKSWEASAVIAHMKELWFPDCYLRGYNR